MCEESNFSRSTLLPSAQSKLQVTSIFVEAALKAATPDFDAVVWE